LQALGLKIFYVFKSRVVGKHGRKDIGDVGKAPK
jgi:hypothetical protein